MAYSPAALAAGARRLRGASGDQLALEKTPVHCSRWEGPSIPRFRWDRLGAALRSVGSPAGTRAHCGPGRGQVIRSGSLRRRGTALLNIQLPGNKCAQRLACNLLLRSKRWQMCMSSPQDKNIRRRQTHRGSRTPRRHPLARTPDRPGNPKPNMSNTRWLRVRVPQPLGR